MAAGLTDDGGARLDRAAAEVLALLADAPGGRTALATSAVAVSLYRGGSPWLLPDEFDGGPEPGPWAAPCYRCIRPR